jgi:branched-chain amino acid transport system permease protein
MNRRKEILLFILLLIVIFPFFSPTPYLTHIVILILIWSGVATAWSYLGRFLIVSLCHGAYIGTAAYITFLFFNYFNLCSWLGMLIGVLLVALIAMVFGFACFRFGLIGHYFAVTTLVFGEMVSLIIIAFREFTEGRLGLTLKPLGPSPLWKQFLYLQFDNRIFYYYLALTFLLSALYIWRKIDQSKMQIAMKAIGDDEVAASSLGIPIARYKTGVAVISAVMAAIGGVIYCQYISYINPVSMVGITMSITIVFYCILGGVFTFWGPTVGAMLTIMLEEFIRVNFGTIFVGYSLIGYALIIIVIIIYLPKGIYGSLLESFHKRGIQKVTEAYE